MPKTSVTKKASKATRSAKISSQQLQLRSQLWEDVLPDDIWDRKKKKGFTTIPRTLPLFMRIMDELSKGQPPSAVYFDLWCRARDEAFVTTSGHQEEMAFASGFSGQRATQSWIKRIDILAQQGFIMLAEGPAGPRTYILILNPYLVVQSLKKKSSITIPNATWNALLQRTTEIGATDFNT